MPTSYPCADNIRAALRAYVDLLTKYNKWPDITNTSYNTYIGVSLVFLRPWERGNYYKYTAFSNCCSLLLVPARPDMYQLYKLTSVM